VGDLDRLNHLIRAGHPCISIVTYEEAEALDLVRRSAVDNGLDLLQWTVIDGLHDGLIAGESEVKDTENPAGALYSLSRLNERIMCVTLDLADHLGDDRTLRALRDLVGRFQRIGSHLVMIDHRSDMPAVGARPVRAGGLISPRRFHHGGTESTESTEKRRIKLEEREDAKIKI
jgi:hypothetical protein